MRMNDEWTMNGPIKVSRFQWEFPVLPIVISFSIWFGSVQISFHLRASGSLSTCWHITSFTRRQRSVPRWLPRCSLLVQHVEKLRPIQHLRTFGNCKAPIETNVFQMFNWKLIFGKLFRQKKRRWIKHVPSKSQPAGNWFNIIYLLSSYPTGNFKTAATNPKEQLLRLLPISIQNLNIWASQHHHHSDHALRRLPLPQRIVFGVHKCCWYPLEISQNGKSP